MIAALGLLAAVAGQPEHPTPARVVSLPAPDVYSAFASAVLAYAHPPTPPGVIAESNTFSPATQWAAIASSARIEGLGGELGTAAVVGVREGSLYLLTANHVVSGSGERQLELFTRETYSRLDLQKERILKGAQISFRSPNTDLAILKVSLRNMAPPPVITVPRPWDRPKRFPVLALSVGCNEARQPSCRVEEIIQKQLVRRSNDFGTFFWKTTAPPVPGRSGGPLLDAKGRLIGICTATQGGAGYYTHLDEIHAWLKTNGLAWIWESVSGRD